MEPSLKSIRTFEAAAAHLSFAKAARQLKVHPPAVSRQVAELERKLGTCLFIRTKPRLKLTAAGQDLYVAVSTGLNEIRQACEKLRLAPSSADLSIVTSIGFASCWLLSRLPDFRKQYPHITPLLTTRDSTDNLDPTDADIAILFADKELPGITNQILFHETMIAVCSPQYLPPNTRLNASQLAAEKLIRYGEASHRNDWRRFLSAHDIKLSDDAFAATYDSYIVYVHATLNGEGIAIGWRHLLDDYLKSGQLNQVSDLSLTTSRGYHCCLMQQARDNRDAQIFLDWIQSFQKPVT